MTNTQSHLNIADIKDDLILLTDGGASLVLQTNAVNFGLLSEMEQVAIIGSFAQLLNSLSFSIQIIIQSTKLDITTYIENLDRAEQSQQNPLLANMMLRYKEFIKSTVKENEVLDKNFYIVISVSSYELGLGYQSMEDKLKKFKILLMPRKDQIIRQLNRVGLKATQLTSRELIKLFFDIYNKKNEDTEPKSIQIEPVSLSVPQSAFTPPPVAQPTKPADIPTPTNLPPSPRPIRNHPFIVEELGDTI